MKTGAMLPLAVERVRYVGEPVVAIAAETRAAGEDAAARVARGVDAAAGRAAPPEAAWPPGRRSSTPSSGTTSSTGRACAGGDAARALDGAHRV